MRAAEIFPTSLIPSRTLIAKAGRTSVAAIVLLRVIVLRMAETAAGAADGPGAVAGGIVDVAGAADAPGAAGAAIVADAAVRAGEGTRITLAGFTRIRRKSCRATVRESWPFCYRANDSYGCSAGTGWLALKRLVLTTSPNFETLRLQHLGLLCPRRGLALPMQESREQSF